MSLISEISVPALQDVTVRMNSVLVADDDILVRTMLESCLRKWQINVTTAKDGLYAWHELQKESCPNLIILDWMMPGISGLELCQRIRARKTACYPYVLLLSAKDAKQDIVEGLDAGADDYLAKPIDTNELRSRLRVGSRILALQNELLRKEEELRFEALHDKLTGLWNRRAIMDFMGRELERGRRRRESVGALMMDLDHFKAINDTHGHQAGDVVLQEVGQRLVNGMRNYDWAARYGGEEFLVLLSNCNAETLVMCAERMRQTICSEPVRLPDLEIPVTVSIGATMFSFEHPLTGDQLVSVADAALYRAKRNGRNRVEIA
jgi:two-component system cell cycle response regulator